jgi:hypothetical protein
MAVMQQAVEHGTDGGDIAEQFAPVLDGTIGSEQRPHCLRSTKPIFSHEVKFILTTSAAVVI